MLRILRSLFGRIIRATNGDIGDAHDFLFEYDARGINYLVTEPRCVSATDYFSIKQHFSKYSQCVQVNFAHNNR